MLNISLMALAFASASLNVSAQTDAATSAQQKADVDLDAKYATNLLEVGSPAPDLAIPSLDGGSVTLATIKASMLSLTSGLRGVPTAVRMRPTSLPFMRSSTRKAWSFSVSRSTETRSRGRREWRRLACLTRR